MAFEGIDIPEELKKDVARIDEAVMLIVQSLTPPGHELDEAEMDFLRNLVEFEMAGLLFRLITTHMSKFGHFVTENRKRKEETDAG